MVCRPPTVATSAVSSTRRSYARIWGVSPESAHGPNRSPAYPHLPSQSMLAHADHSGNGAVSMDDFYRLMKKGGGKKNKIDDLLGDDD